MKYLAMVAALLLVGCTNFDKAFGGWVGYPVDNLVAQWGPPAANHKMQDGTQVISYSAQRYFQVAKGPGIPTAFSGTYWCEVRYAVNLIGVIVSWKSRGNIGGCNTLLRRVGPAPGY